MEIAFLTMEKSKSRILFESFIQLRQSQKIGIPDSLINFKNQLKSELDALKQELISEQQKDPLDSLRIGVLENHIFLNISNQETFSESLSNQYPDYGNIVNKELTGLKGIQSKLKTKHTTLIEYFWGKKTLYSITVGGERTTFHKFPIDHIQEKVNIYLMHLTTGPNFSNQLEQFRKFSENAHTLFKWLFKGIDNTTDQKLIIASDGLLRLIPFEALVMECPGVGITNYEKLIYAIHKYNISYEYSSNFWAAAEPSKKRALQALGFSHSSLNSINAATNEFSQLPGTAQEIELLKNKLDGLYFSGLEATKEHFLENAGNYDIIHLAIHGISDSASHLNNRLLFRDKNSETGSVPLYAHELYSIRLRSRLAVLSACESGIGLNYRGEGVYSISRAFSYAGCPTTIMSLWKINDKTTPIILEWFYHYITKGKDIDQSLRLAKLNYLQNNSGIKAHPSNWAAMVVLGATESLTFHSRTKLIVTIAALLLALFLFFKLKIKSRFQSKGNVFAFLRSGQHGN